MLHFQNGTKYQGFIYLFSDYNFQCNWSYSNHSKRIRTRSTGIAGKNPGGQESEVPTGYITLTPLNHSPVWVTFYMHHDERDLIQH